MVIAVQWPGCFVVSYDADCIDTVHPSDRWCRAHIVDVRLILYCGDGLEVRGEGGGCKINDFGEVMVWGRGWGGGGKRTCPISGTTEAVCGG